MSHIEKHRGDTSDSGWETALGRAAVYGFIADSLLYPTSETRESMRQGLFPLLAGMSLVSEELDKLLADALVAHQVDLDELRLAHGRVFTHIENQDCPAHESAYNPGDVFRRADVMADIAAFYRAHGLKAGGVRRERVDHITTELEFLSFMGKKEAYAITNFGPDEVDECRRTQAHFIRDHFGCWAPGFADRLQVAADHTYFVAVGSLLGTWIEADLEWLGVEPAMNLTEPQPLPPMDDGLCGADVGPGGEIPVEIRS